MEIANNNKSEAIMTEYEPLCISEKKTPMFFIEIFQYDTINIVKK